MIVAVSPYHLTTREPAAFAALLLAERVVTMLPVPLEGKEWGAVQKAALRIPRYLQFMESWRWTMPLWQAGVICSGLEGYEAVDELRPVCGRIDTEERLAPLRSLMKPELFDDHERYLDAVAHDLLRAGPDPGITVPVASGLDSFASRYGAAVARSEPVSVVQKAEAKLGKQVFAIALPILLQGDGERIVEARNILEPELRALRAALSQLAAAITDHPGADLSVHRDQLATAAKAYADAFDSHRTELTAANKNDDVRVVDGTVTLTGILLPADAVLDSSLAAMRTMAPIREPVNGNGTVQAFIRGGSVLSLFVRVPGRAGISRR
jgi:hypothetical protein